MASPSSLIKIEINNNNYSKVKDIPLYITEKLKTDLENIKSDRYENQYKALEKVGFRGGKHLLELLRNQIGSKVIVILSNDKTEINGDEVTINYNDYRKIGSGSFFAVYRQTGLETATSFLLKKLPSIAPALSTTVTRAETEKVIKSLPVSTKLTSKTQNLLLENIAKIIKESKIDRRKLTADNLKEITAASNQAFYKNTLDEFRKRLTKTYPETKGKSSWQRWIYQHKWLFGVGYLEPMEKQKIGFDEIPDYLFPTVDGFLDILEIKVPHKSKIILQDQDHKHSYYWDGIIAKAIGQVTNYLHVLEENQLKVAQIIKREYDGKYPIEISTVKPRAIILAGRTESWKNEQLEALRKLNFSLHNIEVVSYDQLLKRGESLTNLYDIKTSKKATL